MFLVSALLRFLACGGILRKLKEVRVVQPISYRSLFFRLGSPRAQMGPLLRFFVIPEKKR